MKKVPVFEIASVSKTYLQEKKEIHALQDISLLIEKGDTFGIIGLSGAGKSTLIRCLARLVIPSSGKIFFRGDDVAHFDKKQLRNFHQNIGMIFQHFNLLSSRTVAGNIAYPLEIADISFEERVKRVEELLKLVGLEEKKGSYPSQLSGGEKQRVGIARAIAHHPEVLLCDEATSALDPKTTREILRLLKEINQKLGVTIVLITHEMEVIKEICNKVAVIEKGKIVEVGLVSDVFSEPRHATTQHFLQTSAHEIPDEFLKPLSPNRKLVRLRFKGKAAGEPVISEIIKRFQVDANILLGWIDRLQDLSIGTLVVELNGSPESIRASLDYFGEKKVHVEEVESEL